MCTLPSRVYIEPVSLIFRRSHHLRTILFVLFLRIKELDPGLLELPAQAICCGLQLKKPKVWDAAVNEQFESMTADKCLKMTVVKSLDGKLLVILKDDAGMLLNDLFDSGDGAMQDSSEVLSTMSYTAFTNMLKILLYVGQNRQKELF